ncbi:MAG: hypothetical protein MJ239_01235 [Bacilli bacterium]|nr:hypothetical protein [Bacilli bacterium]
MKKFLKFLAPALAALTMVSCGGNGSSQQSGGSSNPGTSSYDQGIGKIQNLAFNEETGIVSYSPIEGVDGYHVSFYMNGELAVDANITETEIDVNDLGLSGEIKVSVYGFIGSRRGEPSSIEFVLDVVMEDVLFEAEDYLANFGTGKGNNSNFRNNPLAHGGAYVGGIDDCGQGVFINYLCPMTDRFEFDLYYLAEQVPGHLAVYVNGEFQTKFVCTKNTGYGGEGMFNPDLSKVYINLVKGWNTIMVCKEGDAYDNYGSFVEMDYFVLKGNGKTYNPTDLKEYGDEPARWRLEAEMGSPRHKNKDNNVFECKNPCIKAHDDFKFSNGYLMGNLDSNYDGVEWQFNAKKAGKYEVTIAYATAMSGCVASFFTTSMEPIDLAHSADFKRMEGSTIALPMTSGWDRVEVATAKCTINLEFDKNYIYCVNMAASDAQGEHIYQIDYVDIKYIGE